MQFTDEINPDGVVRILHAQNWSENLNWITHGVWAPFHYYILGTAFLVHPDYIFTSKLFALSLSVLTLFPFYFFTRREFNKEGALFATITLALSPILFRNSFLSLAGTPFLFFLALSLNCLSKGLKQNKTAFIILSGLLITISSGIRYEGWLVTFLLVALILFKRDLKSFIYFGIASSIFPIFWMISCWKITGDPLYGINGNAKYIAQITGEAKSLNFENILRRIWFFPFSWLISLGPIWLFIVFRYVFNSFKTKTQSTSLNWSILVLSFLAFMIYNTVQGKLLLHQRFIGTLCLISMPLIASFFKNVSKRKTYIASTAIMLMISLSFIYNIGGIDYLPKLRNTVAKEIEEKLNAEFEETESLMIDFISWENTGHIALHSKVHPNNIVINSNQDLEVLKRNIDIHFRTKKNGLIISKEFSQMDIYIESIFSKQEILKERIYQNEFEDGLKIYKWWK